eukprot:3636202-Rhodomonas_salina.1
MLRHMKSLTRLSCRPYGWRSSRSAVGASVASASAPRVSITRLTHRSCTGFSGIPKPQTDPTNETSSATTLTHSWNLSGGGARL